MSNMNNKGFTLVELIATLVILSLVMGIGAVSVTKIINNAKEKDYKLLIENIKNAIEEYYIECKYSYSDSSSKITCPVYDNDSYTIKLGDLVTYGFLKGNDTNEEDVLTLVNPLDNELINDCLIKYNYNTSDGKIKIIQTFQNAKNACPVKTDYEVN